MMIKDEIEDQGLDQTQDREEGLDTIQGIRIIDIITKTENENLLVHQERINSKILKKII